MRDSVEVWLYLKVAYKSWDLESELEEGHEIDLPGSGQVKVNKRVWNVDGDRMWTKRARRPMPSYCTTEDFQEAVKVYAS